MWSLEGTQRKLVASVWLSLRLPAASLPQHSVCEPVGVPAWAPGLCPTAQCSVSLTPEERQREECWSAHFWKTELATF